MGGLNETLNETIAMSFVTDYELTTVSSVLAVFNAMRVMWINLK